MDLDLHQIKRRWDIRPDPDDGSPRAYRLATTHADDVAELVHTLERLVPVIEFCREELEDGHRCLRNADVIIWGKLFPHSALGPRCIFHAAKHFQLHQIGQYAVFDLRALYRERR